MKSNEVIAAARAEIEQEKYRAAIEAEKAKMRDKRSLFDKLFPFTIKIERKKS